MTKKVKDSVAINELFDEMSRNGLTSAYLHTKISQSGLNYLCHLTTVQCGNKSMSANEFFGCMGYFFNSVHVFEQDDVKVHYGVYKDLIVVVGIYTNFIGVTQLVESYNATRHTEVDDRSVFDVLLTMGKIFLSFTHQVFPFNCAPYKRVLYINSVKSNIRPLQTGYTALLLSEQLTGIVFDKQEGKEDYCIGLYGSAVIVIGYDALPEDSLPEGLSVRCKDLIRARKLATDLTGDTLNTVPDIVPLERSPDVDTLLNAHSARVEPIWVSEIKEQIIKVRNSESEESKMFPKQNWNRFVVDVDLEATNGYTLYHHPIDYTSLNVTDTISNLVISTMQYNNMFELPSFAEVVGHQRHGLDGLTKPVFSTLGTVRWINRALHFAQTCHYQASNGDVAHLLSFVADNSKHFVIGSYTCNKAGVDDAIINVYEILPPGVLPTKDVTIDWLLEVLNS